MKQKNPEQFSWTGLFMVTALCFFVFGGLVKLLDGSADHASLFFKIGMVSFVFYAFAYVADISARSHPKRKRRHSKAYVNRTNY